MANYLIIGASSGIGKQLTNQLLEDGHEVYGTYHNNEITDDRVHAQQIDVTTNFELKNLPEHLDGAVYCPGAIDLKPFKRINEEDLQSDFNLQVVGAVKVLQQVYKKLRKSEQAAVVMFSTVAVQNGFNFHAQVASSKGAIEGLVRSLSAEWAPKIRVNAVAPSLTDTPLAEKLLSSEDKKKANADRHPLKKLGEAKDIANAAAYLLTPESSWMTGQVIHVDGGMSTIRS